MEWYTNAMNIIGFAVGIVGFIITIVTFIKVSSIQKARKEYDRLIDVDGLSSLLTDFSACIPQLSCDESVKDAFRERIFKAIGGIDKVKEVLLSEINDVSSRKSPVFFENGYYTHDFLAEKIKKAKKIVRACTKRNHRFTNNDILQNINSLLDSKSTCIIELMSISPKTDDVLLAAVNKTMPIASENTEALRADIEQDMTKIRAFMHKLSEQKRNRFNCYGYLGVPPFHFVQVDNSLFFGLVNYDKTSMQYVSIDKRPYLEFDIKKSNFAKLIVTQFEAFAKCENTCEKIVLEQGEIVCGLEGSVYN